MLFPFANVARTEDELTFWGSTMTATLCNPVVLLTSLRVVVQVSVGSVGSRPAMTLERVMVTVPCCCCPHAGSRKARMVMVTAKFFLVSATCGLLICCSHNQ